MTDFLARHRSTLDKALDACDKRYSWTAYPESPSSKVWGAAPPGLGKARFEQMLGNDYPLTMPGESGRTGAEVRPGTTDLRGLLAHLAVLSERDLLYGDPLAGCVAVEHRHHLARSLPQPLKAGDFALVNPDEKHQYRNKGDKPFKMICGVPKEFE